MPIVFHNACFNSARLLYTDVEETEDVGATSLPTQPPQPSSSSTYDPSNLAPGSYSGIQIPPGAHAPANTPAEVPHSTGMNSVLSPFSYNFIVLKLDIVQWIRPSCTNMRTLVEVPTPTGKVCHGCIRSYTPNIKECRDKRISGLAVEQFSSMCF